MIQQEDDYDEPIIEDEPVNKNTKMIHRVVHQSSSGRSVERFDFRSVDLRYLMNHLSSKEGLEEILKFIQAARLENLEFLSKLNDY